MSILSDQRLLYLFITAVLLGAAAWTSAVEAAFFSLNADDINRFSASVHQKEKNVAILLKDSRLLLLVLTTSKYIVLLATTILAVHYIVYETGSVSAWLSGTLLLVLIVLFSLAGVILPKIYGQTHRLILSGNASWFCRKLVSLLRPVVAPLLRVSLKVEQTLEEKTEEKSVEELTQALQLATVDNEPVEGEKEILEGIVNFGTLTVRQVMRPKAEISYAVSSLNFHELIEFVNKSGYSRVPVCANTLNEIEGFLYIKDLLPFLEEDRAFAWQRLLRPGYFVPETKKLDSLLNDFQEKRVHMAVVVNPQGQTSGLITLEDIIEEIIGDINDEFDEVGARYQKLDAHTFLFDGKTSLHEFCKIVQADPTIFHPVKGLKESLSGILVEINGALPEVGSQVVIEPFTFIIESVDHNRIKKIRVETHVHSQK